MIRNLDFDKLLAMTKTNTYTVLFEKDEDNFYVASVPGLPGCYTQGKTLEEAQSRIKEVIELCLDDQRDQNNSYTPSTFVGIQQLSIAWPN